MSSETTALGRATAGGAVITICSERTSWPAALRQQVLDTSAEVGVSSGTSHDRAQRAAAADQLERVERAVEVLAVGRDDDQVERGGAHARAALARAHPQELALDLRQILDAAPPGPCSWPSPATAVAGQQLLRTGSGPS